MIHLVKRSQGNLVSALKERILKHNKVENQYQTQRVDLSRQVVLYVETPSS